MLRITSRCFFPVNNRLFRLSRHRVLHDGTLFKIERRINGTTVCAQFGPHNSRRDVLL
jgi:hypothetical protein